MANLKTKNEQQLKYQYEKIVNPKRLANINLCSICFEVMGNQHNNMPCCGQFIHNECLAKASSYTCPMCHQDITEKIKSLSFSYKSTFNRSLIMKKLGINLD